MSWNPVASEPLTVRQREPGCSPAGSWLKLQAAHTEQPGDAESCGVKSLLKEQQRPVKNASFGKMKSQLKKWHHFGL